METPVSAAGKKTAVSPELLKNLPFKQRAALMYADRLEFAGKRHPHISYRLEDTALATDLAEIFGKIGLEPHPQPDQAVKVLIHNIVKWIDNGHLVMLHFKPKFTDFNLVHLLREVKLAAPGVSLKPFIPVFVGNISSQKQREVFRLLGGFGIRAACFLTPNASAEKNIEEVLSALERYGAVMKAELEGGAHGGAPLDVETAPDPAATGTYKQLLAKGEELMRAGDYEAAIQSFSDAIALGPNFEALMERGDAYYKAKEFIPALGDYREAARLEKTAPDPYAKIGACCLSLVKTAVKTEGAAKARQWFDTGMKYLADAETIVKKMEHDNRHFPEKLPPAPYAPILAALAEGDIRGLGLEGIEGRLDTFAAAVLQKTKAQEDVISDNSVDTRIDRAILLTRHRQYEEAERIFRSVAAEDPVNTAAAFNNFAVELRKNERHGKAFDIYRELLVNDIPDRDIVVENMKLAGFKRAAALKESNRHDEAITVYRAIMDCRPKGREWVLCEMAHTFLDMQDQARAAFTLMEAIYVNPKLMESEQFAPYPDLASLRKEMMKKLLESEPGRQIR
ncbi:MAG: tetratricopeptide repeat protein [Nitrospinae bacterium]|nr:tetratricopeptide repeat protein [Nitrospinota bacterium]